MAAGGRQGQGVKSVGGYVALNMSSAVGANGVCVQKQSLEKRRVHRIQALLDEAFGNLGFRIVAVRRCLRHLIGREDLR